MTPSTLTAGRPTLAGLLTRTALISALLVAVVGGLTTSPASAGSCRTAWGSLSKSAAPADTTGHVTAVRTGRHACFDRLVVDVDGDLSGYRVEYVTSPTADGSGKDVPVKGGAILKIVADVPAYDDAGAATIDPARVNATNVDRYRTF